MNQLHRYLPFVLLSIVLVAGSFFLGRATREAPSADSEQVTSFLGGNRSERLPRNEALKGLSASPAWSSSGIKIPREEYTLESFKETARQLNRIRGYRPARLLELTAVQQALGKQDVAALIDELRFDPSPETANAMYLAFGVYTEQQPVAALDYLLADFTNKNLRGSRKMVIAANMEIDPQQTLAKLQQIDNEKERSRAIQYAIAAIAGKDPARAFEMTQTYGLKDGRYESASTLFSEWGRQDPQAATTVLSQITDTKTREEAIENLVWSWTKSDPAAAWKWAQEQPAGSRDYQDARAQTLRAWATVDPQAALEAALSLENASLRKASLPRIINEWSEKDPDAALNWVSNESDVELMSNMLREMSYRGAIGHERLFQVMNEHMPAGRTYQHSITNLMHRWADQDPAAAADAIMQLPPGQVRSYGASNVARQWARADPAAALEWVRSLPGGEMRNNVRNNTLNQIAQSDPELAKSYYSGLPVNERAEVASQIASGMAHREPQQAIRFAQSIADSASRQQMQESIARQWGRNDPQQAAQWAKSLPGEARSGVLAGLVDSWAAQNTEAAAEWLAQFPADASLDQATRNLTRHMVAENPEAAVSWAQSITDEGMRQSSLISTLNQWKRYDATSAKQWIRQSNLPETQKAGLLK